MQTRSMKKANINMEDKIAADTLLSIKKDNDILRKLKLDMLEKERLHKERLYKEGMIKKYEDMIKTLSDTLDHVAYQIISCEEEIKYLKNELN